jgi:ATP-dependent 26S proteasome regulatory subunit
MERGLDIDKKPQYLPSFIDKESEILSLSRFAEIKSLFYDTDPTAKYLTELIQKPSPSYSEKIVVGSFSWLKNKLNLNDISCFILAIGLLKSFDNAAGAIFASCNNDPVKNYPTLALAQKLWGEPSEIYELISPKHPLLDYGIVRIINAYKGSFEFNMEGILAVPPILTTQLLYPNNNLVHGLEEIPISNGKSILTDDLKIIGTKIKYNNNTNLKTVPIIFPLGFSSNKVLFDISQLVSRNIVEFKGNTAPLTDSWYFKSILTLCWLKNIDLFINPRIFNILENNSEFISSLIYSPITVYIGIYQKSQLNVFPDHILYPILSIPHSSFNDRLKYWKKYLRNKSISEEILLDCAKSFRFEKETIKAISEVMNKHEQLITKKLLFQACRLEINFGDFDLVQRLKPRFEYEDIILPAEQQYQLQEIIKAMRALTRVYYDWNLADVWNESGITVLFEGNPGTGKTMAAEIIAKKMQLPLFKIDLSQVVSKYIGETEKNLKKIFDYAEISDIILFFDEADAIFGKRTEIKDSHDRYANITVSYLLQRMENFKGLAILATNRKINIDEAFKRRIRYIVNFPLPQLKERKLLWQKYLPYGMDLNSIDLEFLSKQFHLSGGNIKSIILNACLQSAGKFNPTDSEIKIEIPMKEIIIAVQREYEKIERNISLEQFGPYAHYVQKKEVNEIE